MSPTKAVTIPSRNKLAEMLALPDPETVTNINKVSQAGPKYVSLKDHDEYNGMAILVKTAEIVQGTIPDQQTGAINDYVRAIAFIYPPSRKPTQEDVVILQSGAGEIFRRLGDAITDNKLPVDGILHKHGRAWTID